jgi:transposase
MSDATANSWVAMDTDAETIHVAIFRGQERNPSEEFQVSSDSRGVGRLKNKLGKENGQVKCVYEAGPCGYGLHRQLKEAGFECEVIAPSLTPRKPGQQVKTNRLDARRLGVLYRGGQLTAVRVPDEEQEALRDLLRARDDVRRDVMQRRQRLNGFLLRHGYYFTAGQNHWTQKHWTWIKALVFPERLQRVVDEYISAVESSQQQLQRFDKQIDEIAQEPAYAAKVARYSVLRGIRTLGAMTILAEGGDLRQYASAVGFMGATGMVPRESSTGDRQRRGSITKAGNGYLRRILIEASWSYQKRGHGGAAIQKRRRNQPEWLLAIATKADQRLHQKFTKLQYRYNKKAVVAAVAAGRELAGFIWAIGQQIDKP